MAVYKQEEKRCHISSQMGLFLVKGAPWRHTCSQFFFFYYYWHSWPKPFPPTSESCIIATATGFTWRNITYWINVTATVHFELKQSPITIKKLKNRVFFRFRHSGSVLAMWKPRVKNSTKNLTRYIILWSCFCFGCICSQEISNAYYLGFSAHKYMKQKPVKFSSGLWLNKPHNLKTFYNVSLRSVNKHNKWILSDKLVRLSAPAVRKHLPYLSVFI